MKKAVAVPLFVLLTILGFTLYNSFFMNQNAARWCGQLQQAVLFLRSEEWDHVKSALEQSYSDWSAHQTYLHIVSTHDGINAAESMYCRALAFTAAQEPSELQAEIADLQAQLRFLAEMEQFSIHNIL